MESKECKKCKQVKELWEFTLNKLSPFGRGSYCKKCSQKYSRKYQTKRLADAKDGRYYVYLLTEDGYCGQTEQPVIRKAAHKTNGKNAEKMKLVASFNTREEALKLEAQYHSMGWQGANNIQTND